MGFVFMRGSSSIATGAFEIVVFQGLRLAELKLAVKPDSPKELPLRRQLAGAAGR